MKIHLQRTNASNIDFIALVKMLDAGLAITDGDDHAFYDQFNKLDAIKHVIVAYSGETPIACGAFKAISEDTVEIKRMFTSSNSRGKGLATKVLEELELWAKESSFSTAILETGTRQLAAIALYKKSGYVLIENYGPYKGVENSVCFSKNLNKKNH